jgi:hypothetical protein
MDEGNIPFIADGFEVESPFFMQEIEKKTSFTFLGVFCAAAFI